MDNRQLLIYFGGWVVMLFFFVLGVTYSLWLVIPAFVFEIFWLKAIFK